MALDVQQVEQIRTAVSAYDFPLLYWDFENDTRAAAASIGDLEDLIRGQLISTDPEMVKRGLANVVYWGNATAGYGSVRMTRFLTGITTGQLVRFQALVAQGAATVKEIRRLRMPQFSGISFISKVIMFLDPVHQCVLDLQIRKLAAADGVGAIANIKNGTQIYVTQKNCAAYAAWCQECVNIGERYFDGDYRAADIERGFFHLIRSGHLNDARKIYADALA